MQNDTLKKFLSGLCIVSLVAGAALSFSGCSSCSGCGGGQKGPGGTQSSESAGGSQKK